MEQNKIDTTSCKFDIGDRIRYVRDKNDTVQIKDIVQSKKEGSIVYIIKDNNGDVSYMNIDHEDEFELDTYDIYYAENQIIDLLKQYFNREQKYAYINPFDNAIKMREHEYKSKMIQIPELFEDYEATINKDEVVIHDYSVIDKIKIKKGSHYIFQKA